ncbi:MAG: hypothetical protein Kow0069_36080 [Promethearchaeota archaeon]
MADFGTTSSTASTPNTTKLAAAERKPWCPSLLFLAAIGTSAHAKLASKEADRTEKNQPSTPSAYVVPDTGRGTCEV